MIEACHCTPLGQRGTRVLLHLLQVGKLFRFILFVLLFNVTDGTDWDPSNVLRVFATIVVRRSPVSYVNLACDELTVGQLSSGKTVQHDLVEQNGRLATHQLVAFARDAAPKEIKIIFNQTWMINSLELIVEHFRQQSTTLRVLETFLRVNVGQPEATNLGAGRLGPSHGHGIVLTLDSEGTDCVQMVSVRQGFVVHSNQTASNWKQRILGIVFGTVHLEQSEFTMVGHVSEGQVG